MALVKTLPILLHLTILAGKKASGKSYLACKLLCTSYRYKYDSVIFISPTFRAQVDGLWDKLAPQGIEIHETLTEQLVMDIMEKVKNNKAKDIKTLLVLDDLGQELRKIAPRVLNMLVSNSRHYNLSLLCLHQRLTQSSTIFRANADVIIAFSACSYLEIECLWKMVATVPRRDFQKMFTEATQTPHSFMCCTVDEGGRLRFYMKDFTTEIKPNK